MLQRLQPEKLQPLQYHTLPKLKVVEGGILPVKNYNLYNMYFYECLRLLGKGNKVRLTPLSKDEASNLLTYVTECGLDGNESKSKPLFPNPHGNRLTRMAVLNIVKKYSNMARSKNPDIIPEDLSCHSLRHSKAMHMLEADINLVYIRDFLGHSSVTTTEVYARASEKMKRDALAKLDNSIVKEGKTSWQKDKGLLAYLKALQNKY